LDMGDPIKIDDLAKNMIRLSGKKVDEEIKIEYVGLRAGEKLYEELFHEQEQLQETAMDGIFYAQSRQLEDAVDENLKNLLKSLQEKNKEAAISVLTQLVPEANLVLAPTNPQTIH